MFGPSESIRVTRIIHQNLRFQLLLHLQKKKKKKKKKQKKVKKTTDKLKNGVAGRANSDQVAQSSYANHTYFLLRVYIEL